MLESDEFPVTDRQALNVLINLGQQIQLLHLSVSALTRAVQDLVDDDGVDLYFPSVPDEKADS